MSLISGKYGDQSEKYIVRLSFMNQICFSMTALCLLLLISQWLMMVSVMVVGVDCASNEGQLHECDMMVTLHILGLAFSYF